jgi:hypothetical protein
MTSYYSIRISLQSDSSQVFYGYFSVIDTVDPTQKLVTHFYDYTNSSVDIYI